MIKNLDRYTKRFWYMAGYYMIVGILIVAINIYQYPGTLHDRSLYGMIAALNLLGILIYTSNLLYSLLIFLLAGLIGWLGGSTVSGGMQTLSSLVGILVYLIRVMIKKSSGEYNFGETAKERFQSILNINLKLFKLDRIYNLILFVFMTTLILQSRNDYIKSNTAGLTERVAWLLSFTTYTPVFAYLFMAGNTINYIYLIYIQSIIGIIWLIIRFIGYINTDLFHLV